MTFHTNIAFASLNPFYEFNEVTELIEAKFEVNRDLLRGSILQSEQLWAVFYSTFNKQIIELLAEKHVDFVVSKLMLIPDEDPKVPEDEIIQLSDNPENYLNSEENFAAVNTYFAYMLEYNKVVYCDYEKSKAELTQIRKEKEMASRTDLFHDL